MCLDPLTIAGAAATAGGLLMNNSASGDVSRARSDIMSAENARQQGFASQGQEIFSRTLPKFDIEAQKEGMAAAGDRRSTALRAAVTPASPSVPVSGNAPSIVTDAISRAMAGADAAGNDYAGRLGQAGAYGDQNFSNRVTLNRSGQEADKIASFARGSAGVTPVELAAANEAGNNKKVVADLLSGLGQVGMFAGLSGAGPGSFSALLKGGPGSMAVTSPVMTI